jgi:hypothetical protein
MCLVLRWIPGCTFARASDCQQRRDEVDDVYGGKCCPSDNGRTRDDRFAWGLAVLPLILA